MITDEYIGKLQDLFEVASPVFDENPTMTNNDAFRLWLPMGFSQSSVRRVMTALRRGVGIDANTIRYRVHDPESRPPTQEEIAPLSNEVDTKIEAYELELAHVEEAAMYIAEQYRRIHQGGENFRKRGKTAECYVNNLNMSERQRTRLLSVASSYAQLKGWIPIYVVTNR